MSFITWGFCCCFSHLRLFLPNMNNIIKVESAMHYVSDFDLFTINFSAVYLAETTGSSCILNRL